MLYQLIHSKSKFLFSISLILLGYLCTYTYITKIENLTVILDMNSRTIPGHDLEENLSKIIQCRSKTGKWKLGILGFLSSEFNLQNGFFLLYAVKCLNSRLYSALNAIITDPVASLQKLEKNTNLRYTTQINSFQL